jgi:internalin A
MSSDPEGLAIARARIAAEQETRTGYLDLGQLGLAELPEELFALEHLGGLNLGSGWRDETGSRHSVEARLGANRVASQLAQLRRFHRLRLLSLSNIQFSDLSALAGLTGLRSLCCDDTEVSDLSPLTELTALQSLSCSDTQVSDLRPLAGLTALQSLSCSRTQVSDLSPLARLTALRSLSCNSTQVRDLSPLAGLTALQSLSCSETQVIDLSPLARLTALQTLSCFHTLVSDLSPLARLTALQTLSCFSTLVSDLSPLARLTALKSLSCFRTQVSDLSPLARLTALQSLSCNDTRVSDLSPLACVATLQSLDCSGTQVRDLSALVQLGDLRKLNCSSTPLSTLSDALVWHPSLRELRLFDTRITKIPTEVLSRQSGDNCLDRVRAHLRDLEAGDEILPDTKVLVLGNGRIGKTQICRRLRGEAFEPDADSTHGIRVVSAELPVRPRGMKTAESPSAPGEATVHLWDFGGQDLYHGTHALFMRTTSVFIAVWTPQSDDTQQYEYGGTTFCNHPLAYWIEFIRHQSGAESPVLIVQNMCERPKDAVLHLPVEDRAAERLGFCKVLQYSALQDRGRAALDEALAEAILWLRETKGQARIGKGRLEVKRALEALRDDDVALPVEERRNRTVSQDQFHKMCSQAGNVSSPDFLLDYLHHAGVVFYQRGLFDDRIVLDQGWALEAIYAVFQRQKCYRQLRQLRGRFTRTLLEALAWRNYSASEQQLLLSLMTSCGICFVHREEDREGQFETEYIAPDLLPSRDEVAAEIDATWGEPAHGGNTVVELPFLHPGVMRGVISRIGRKAGMSAVYWKQGVCLYEKSTRSRALIEQRPSNHHGTWSGQIVVSTRGGQSAELLTSLENWIKHELEHAGCRNWRIERTSDSNPAIFERKDRDGSPADIDSSADGPERKLEFTPPPSDKKTYFISYAWYGESTAIVEDVCQEAMRRGIEILRDVTGIGLGGSIVQFMQRVGTSDRVIVILSDIYLKSPYCMFELLEVWRNCRMADDVFRGRIRVFRLPDAKMLSPLERALYAVYWKEQFRELDAVVREHGADLLGTEDFKRFKLMQDFAHHVGDMLTLIADTLAPRDIEELKRHAFDDAGPSSRSESG